MLLGKGRLGDVRILGRMAVESLSTQRLHNVPDYCWGATSQDHRYGIGAEMRHFIGSLKSPETFYHEGAGTSVLLIDPVEELVCACVYPVAANVWSGECNHRLPNVIWSGLI